MRDLRPALQGPCPPRRPLPQPPSRPELPRSRVLAFWRSRPPAETDGTPEQPEGFARRAARDQGRRTCQPHRQARSGRPVLPGERDRRAVRRQTVSPHPGGTLPEHGELSGAAAQPHGEGVGEVVLAVEVTLDEGSCLVIVAPGCRGGRASPQLPGGRIAARLRATAAGSAVCSAGHGVPCAAWAGV